MSTTLLKLVADLNLSLASAVSVGATTATLSSATDEDGVALPSGKYGFTIDGDNSAKEYIVADLVGTALTGILHISRQGASSSGFANYHRVGATVTITDWAILSRMLNNLTGATGFDSATALSYDGSVAGLTGNQIPTVNYVLSVVNGGTVTFDQQVASAQTAGENLTALDHVYFKESDSKWWKVDADDTATFQQVRRGIALGTVSADSTTSIAISGPVTMSGLTTGSKYYASNTGGAISTTPGTYTVFVGWALSATSLLLDPYGRDIPYGAQKDALVGGSTFGTPSSTNKYITQDYNSSATGLPTTKFFTNIFGDSTTQFDITNPAGTTFRYTYDSTGTDPAISSTTVPIGTTLILAAQNFTAANNGTFVTTGVGANYFEVTNASGVVESNKTIGSGSIKYGYTKPTGLKYIMFEAVGGGGGGGGASGNGGDGGGSGAYGRWIIPTASITGTATLTIGAAGTAGSSGSGGNGGSSSFDAIAIAGGGTGGATNSGAGGVGGTASGSITAAFSFSTTGGKYQADTAPTPDMANSGSGGDSFWGKGGQFRATAAAGASGALDGLVGSGYGSGGSGSIGTNTGGAGRQGAIAITEYYS